VILASNIDSLSINGFDIEFSITDLKIFVKYNGTALSNLIKPPSIEVNPYDPLNSRVIFEITLPDLANKVFDTMSILNSKNEPCLAALFGSHFYELAGGMYSQLLKAGNHVLSVPLWRSVLELVSKWKGNHIGVQIHTGTPLYFLSEAYLLMQNNDMAFAYLIKSIEDDTDLGKDCPTFGYPLNEPAFRTACLIDNKHNHMYEFIVKPLRRELENSIYKYNKLFGSDSHLSNISDFDNKFLQKQNTTKIKIEYIKYLFVLELIKLLQLRSIKVDSRFFPTLLLNRLFGLSLVIDKLLYVNYPPRVSKKKRGHDSQMRACITSYGVAHSISQKHIDNLKLMKRSPDKALVMLLKRRSQNKFRTLPREIYPILISYVVRNTSAHKIQAITLISSEFDAIFQSLLEAVFIIVGQMSKSLR
jgi:hypothetical protein